MTSGGMSRSSTPLSLTACSLSVALSTVDRADRMTLCARNSFPLLDLSTTSLSSPFSRSCLKWSIMGFSMAALGYTSDPHFDDVRRGELGIEPPETEEPQLPPKSPPPFWSADPPETFWMALSIAAAQMRSSRVPKPNSSAISSATLVAVSLCRSNWKEMLLAFFSGSVLTGMRTLISMMPPSPSLAATLNSEPNCLSLTVATIFCWYAR
mmetsp:Transcript_11060/g.33768  ORF Transcript_11060/g.33768 Transcript_11060/m.33768 type:complete len:210 (+) Transcript_11060:244-873(+)